jgi:HD superfamily phosphodiesterase
MCKESKENVRIKKANIYYNDFPNGALHDPDLKYKCVFDFANIDDSHNYKHSKEVLHWSIEIMERLPYLLSRHEITMIAECCILHDLMDSKYTDFSKEIRAHLLTKHSTRHTDVMMNIMNTMSYSKIVSSDTHEVCYPDWITMSPFKHAFHIVREADLLSSYNLARMVEFRLFNKTKYELYSRNDIQKTIRTEVRELYNERMGKLIERNLFIHPSTRKLAESLDEVSKIKLSLIDYVDLNHNLDILRHVNYLSLDNLVDRLNRMNDICIEYDDDGYEWEWG